MNIKPKIDMINGPLLPGLIRFSLPVMATGILQLLYNAADIVVVGRFAGKEALAAVGATGAMINLIFNLFIGLSIGANVVVARTIGARNRAGTHRAVHTSILVSLICGVGVAVFGFFSAETLLRMMNTPPDVIDLATVYTRIFFLGSPFNLLYNFGASILRATGDTRRPLIFLTVSGVVNVILNLFFVIALNMSVAGVAIATVISQLVSSVFVVIALIRDKGDIRLTPRLLRIHRRELMGIVRVGIPSGIQGCLFSFSNVMLQSSYNSFGSTAMAGISAGGNLDGFVYISMNAVYQAALTYASQNYGARNYRRLPRIMGRCLALVTAVGVALGALEILLGRPLLSIYSPDPSVIDIGMRRLLVIDSTYFLCGIMEIFAGMLRGIDRSLFPMGVSVAGVVGIRLLWIYAVFPLYPTLESLLISYPVSWIITVAALLVGYLYYCRRLVTGRSKPDADLPSE